MTKKTKGISLIAIVSCTFSILIALVYLLLITALDARGPMLPPPPEALSEEVAPGKVSLLGVQLPSGRQSLGIFQVRFLAYLN